MKILVPVDGSAYTKRMLAYLAAHDEWLGERQQYTLIHVTVPFPARAASVLEKDVLSAFHEEQAEKVFKPIRSFFARQKLKANFVTKVGDPASVVGETARKGRFDLIVMGSHGHGALGGLVLGSVTTRVLARCATPVLIVR